MGVVTLRGQLDRALADLTPAIVGRQLLVGRGRANVAHQEIHVRERDHRVDLTLFLERPFEQGARAVDRGGVLVVADDERARRLGRRLGSERRRGDQDERGGEQRAGTHPRAL